MSCFLFYFQFLRDRNWKYFNLSAWALQDLKQASELSENLKRYLTCLQNVRMTLGVHRHSWALKLDLKTDVWVFCLHVFLSSPCIQYMQKPEEDVRSVETGVTDRVVRSLLELGIELGNTVSVINHWLTSQSPNMYYIILYYTILYYVMLYYTISI